MRNYYAEKFAAEAAVINNPPPILSDEPPPIPDAARAVWYYVSGGKQIGPVDEQTVEGLAQHTLIWKKGMPDWKPASEVFAPPTISGPLGKLPRRGFDSQRDLITPVVSGAAVSDTVRGWQPPVTVPQSEVNNIAVWCWAFSPLLILFIRGDQFSTPGYFIFWFIILAIFFAWDTHLIKNSGRRNDFWGWFWLIGGFYLFVRAAKLQVSNKHGWIWLACLIGSVLVSVAASR